MKSQTQKKKKLSLTEKQLITECSPKTFERARGYVDEFTKRLIRENIISGTVEGNYGSYNVSLGVSSEGLVPNCNCPADMYFCKHAVALGLTYIDQPDSFYDFEDVKSLLEAKSKPELAELLSQIIAKYPQALSILGVEGFEEAESDLDEDEYY